MQRGSTRRPRVRQPGGEGIDTHHVPIDFLRRHAAVRPIAQDRAEAHRLCRAGRLRDERIRLQRRRAGGLQVLERFVIRWRTHRVANGGLELFAQGFRQYARRMAGVGAVIGRHDKRVQQDRNAAADRCFGEPTGAPGKVALRQCVHKQACDGYFGTE